jgi:glycosyltransferase involved in cell wall biosynthesis/membrane-associated phospholipid phosphatase
MQVSLIVTVFNEGDTIRTLMDTILQQPSPPDEIVITDGGSTDNTVEILSEYKNRLPLKVIELEGANISTGRNVAVQNAQGPIIAVTDAGVRLHPNWLEEITRPIESAPDIEAVAGFFVPDPQSAFEVAMGATVLPVEGDVDPESFMPSSRSVAFLKSAWEAVGGYPEWLDYGEDLIFDFRMAALFGSFVFAPKALVYFRPRSTLTAFFRQYYFYARGDGKAGLFFHRHLIRYLTYFAALPAIIAGAIFGSHWWLLTMIPAAFYMFANSYRRLFDQWGKLNLLKKLQTLLMVPIIRVTGDIAKMIGYPIGLVWRYQNNSPNWRIEPTKKAERELGGPLGKLIAHDTFLSRRLGIAEQEGLPRTLAILVTRSGDGLVFLTLLAVMYVFADPRGRAILSLWLLADFLTGVVVQVLKTFIRRPRPVGEWGRFYRKFDPHSFPSGHSARGGVLTMVGFILAPPWARILLGLWGALIATSRVLLGVHYPSDVFVGFMLGLATTGLTLVLLMARFS